MIASIVRIVLVTALVAAVLFGIVWGYETWRDGKVAEGYRAGAAAGAAKVQALWDAERKESDRTTLLTIALARQEEQEIAAKAAKGERDARDRAEAQAQREAAAAHRSRAAAVSVREQLAALDAAAAVAGVPSAASCPSEFAAQRDAAVRARAVVGACTAEYQLLAERAGRERADFELRLDTALSWIRATGAPGSQP